MIVNRWDSIETIVDDNYSFPGQTYIYIGDLTSTSYFGKTFSYGQIIQDQFGKYAWEPSNHSSAEWVVEKTQTYLDLSYDPGCPSGNSHCVTLTQAHAVRNGSDTYIDALPTKAVTMWTPDWSKEMAYPGPIHNSGGSAFFNNYLAYTGYTP
ncbi:MAG TPA: hypothetical protein VIG77_10165 [Ktedonobacterales bacterium]